MPEQEDTNKEEAAQPPDLPGNLTEQDVEFVQRFRESEAEPPDLPRAEPTAPPVKPKVSPARPPSPPADDAQGGADLSGIAQSASVGGRFAGPVGALLGAGAGLLMGRGKDAPIGGLEGTGTQRDESAESLRTLVELQRKIAAVGTPIKDAITTQAVGSRM